MVKFLSEFKSIRENIIDSILDKIVVSKITQEDIDMLNLVNNKEIKEWHLISINSLIQVLKELLEKNEKVLCKLTDSQGEINLFIIDVENDKENYFLNLERKNSFRLKDNFLYNVKFNFDKNYWIVEYNDEYNELLD